MQSIETDVLVIGSGLAGLRAAIEAAKNGARTTVVSKSPLEVGSNSALAGGGITAAVDEKEVESHIRETMNIGKGLNDLPLVTELARSVLKEIEWIKGLGIELLERPPMGYRVEKTGFPARTLGGRILVKTLLREAGRSDRIQFLPGFYVHTILADDGEARGVVGFDEREQPCSIAARSTVLAAGGGAAIYKQNDNYRKILGDGYALALEAGLSLVDMEFVQFYPFGFAEPGLPQAMIYPPYPKEVRLLDSEGRDFLKKHGIDMSLDKLIVTLRDKSCYLIYKESQSGKVSMDYTRVPDSTWEKYPLNLFPQKRFNFREKPFGVSPLAHFFMGGVRINPECETGLRGLYAAGEVTGGLHGGNRMGGNALAECLVFGAKSGAAAARYAGSQSSRTPLPVSKNWPGSLLTSPGGSAAGPGASALLRAVRDLAWRCAGPIRNEQQMNEGLSSLETLSVRANSLDASTVRGLISKKEIENSLIVLQAVLASSLARKESRGSLQREDFPSPGDDSLLKHISVKMKGARNDLDVNWEDLNA